MQCIHLFNLERQSQHVASHRPLQDNVLETLRQQLLVTKNVLCGCPAAWLGTRTEHSAEITLQKKSRCRCPLGIMFGVDVSIRILEVQSYWEMTILIRIALPLSSRAYRINKGVSRKHAACCRKPEMSIDEIYQAAIATLPSLTNITEALGLVSVVSSVRPRPRRRRTSFPLVTASILPSDQAHVHESEDHASNRERDLDARSSCIPWTF